MAVTGTLHKIVFGGKLALTEEWSCSVHFLTPGVVITDAAQAWTAIRDWWVRGSSCNSNIATFDWIKINAIDPVTGWYLDPDNANFYDVLPKVTGVASAVAPHLSSAVSTTTSATRGLASKGRFYPPTGIAGAIGADGRTTAVSAQGMATSAAQLITDLNGAYEGECVVFSKKGQVTREILGVRVGRVVDHQHRRRRNLVEDHQPALVS